MFVEPGETNTAARNQQNLLFLDCSGGSRPSDRKRGWGGSHPDSKVTGGRSPKKYFLSFGPYFGLKIAEGVDPRAPSPESASGLLL